MVLIERIGRAEIWVAREAHGIDYWVYGVTADPRVCPSIGLARSFAAGA